MTSTVSRKKIRRKWRDDQMAQVAAARESAEAAVKEAKARDRRGGGSGESRPGGEQSIPGGSDHRGHSAQETRLKYLPGIRLFTLLFAATFAPAQEPRGEHRQGA